MSILSLSMIERVSLDCTRYLSTLRAPALTSLTELTSDSLTLERGGGGGGGGGAVKTCASLRVCVCVCVCMCV